MEKCRIIPNVQGYSVDLFSKSKSTILSGGVTNIRSTAGRKSYRVNVEWVVNFCDYNYIMMFYLYCKYIAFQIDLITTGSLITYTCKFVPGSFKASLTNMQWTIDATLEVMQ